MTDGRPGPPSQNPSHSEVGLTHVGRAEEVVAAARQRDLAVFDHVPAVTEPERTAHVLFHEEDCSPLAVHGGDDFENQPNRQGGEAERWLVEQEEPWPRHETPSDGEHLLLAAGEGARSLPLALPESREEAEHAVEARPASGPGIGGPRAHLEVLPDGEARKQLAAFGNGREPQRDDLSGREAGERPAPEDGVPAPDWDETGQGAEGRRLAG